MSEDQSAAHSVCIKAMADARIHFELAFEKLSAMIPCEKAEIDWSHAGAALQLLELTKLMCEDLSVDEADIAEGYGE